MGAFSNINGMKTPNSLGSIGAIPKGNSAYTILQNPKYENMGDVNWSTGETWGVLIAGAVVGLSTILLFNRYYR